MSCSTSIFELCPPLRPRQISSLGTVPCHGNQYIIKVSGSRGTQPRQERTVKFFVPDTFFRETYKYASHLRCISPCVFSFVPLCLSLFLLAIMLFYPFILEYAVILLNVASASTSSSYDQYNSLPQSSSTTLSTSSKASKSVKTTSITTSA